MTNLTLSIHHNIYLTREERYLLHQGQELDIVGVSIPVWIIRDKTSEPAREVFCRYTLKNNHEDEPIKINPDGYEITLPCQEPSTIGIDNDTWRSMSPSEKIEYYDHCKPGVNSQYLLDLVDGGAENMMYREYNKMKVEGQMLNVVHFIAINDIQRLTSTIA